MGLAGCPRLSTTELRERGYLQEANRLFFHPLGLAMAVQNDEVFVIDSRDDAEGVNFAGVDLEDKAEQIRHELERRSSARRDALGYVVQPTESA